MVKQSETAKIEKKGEETGLTVVQNNPELVNLYRANATLGAENLGGELPLLKVHITGKSTKNILANGELPLDGWFFYKPTKEDFDEIQCHILTISKGFRSEDLQKRQKFNQIMAGTIITDEGLKPFVMYFTGKKLSNLWAFGKEASRFTKSRSLPIPLFAMTVKLTTEKVDNGDLGHSWIVVFEIVKNPDGTPVVVTDIPLFKKLKEEFEVVDTMIGNLIESKSTEEVVEKEPVHVETVDEEPRKGEEVPSTDIPF